MINHLGWLKWISELQALAQSGLAYCRNEFDIERYERLHEIAAALAAEAADHPLNEVTRLFSFDTGYATPKVDVRAFVLKDHQLLLVKEKADSLWSLPGGWVDVNESPSEAVVRETKEETGFDVSAVKLLALWDKLKHDHPPQWPHVYKCFFHCLIVSGEPNKNIEISDQGFFDLDNLPDLSTHRVTVSQIKRLNALVVSPQDTQFD